MALFVDDRRVATSGLSHIEADVEWRSLPPGDHTIRVEATAADGHRAEAAATFSISDVFELWPEHGEVITGTRVVVTWFSPQASDSLVEYRKVGDQDWHRDEGRPGRHHKVVLDGVEAGISYEFRAGGGKVWSEPRTFALQKGLAFERARYGVTIPRDYGQAMPVTVRNNSDHPMEVVLECLPPDDKELLVEFVGEGSEDRPVHLPPGEIRQFRLVLSAQDCIHELHRFLVRIRSRDGYGDQAEIEVRVKLPNVDLQWEELETNSSTLGKKLRLINKGDGLTDLTVRTTPAGAFRLRPSIEHAVLAANESMELWAVPVLYEGFRKIDGEVKIESFGKTFSHRLECAAPKGMQVYQVTTDPTFLEEIRSWYCTNRPDVVSTSRIPPFLTGPQQKTDEHKETVGLCEEWLKVHPHLKDVVRSELLMTKEQLQKTFQDAEEDYNKRYGRYPHSGETNQTLGVTRLLWFLATFGDGLSEGTKKDFYTGQETALSKELYRRIRVSPDARFSPGDLYRIGLDLCSGDQFEALLTCHNMMRGATRGRNSFRGQLSEFEQLIVDTYDVTSLRTDPGISAEFRDRLKAYGAAELEQLQTELRNCTGEGVDADLLKNHLLPIREENGAGDSGGYYHLFGTATMEYQSEQDALGAAWFLQQAITVGALPAPLIAKFGIGKSAACALGTMCLSPDQPQQRLVEFYSALYQTLMWDKDREGSRAAHLAVLLEERVLFPDPDITEYCLDVFGISVGFNLHQKAKARESGPPRPRIPVPEPDHIHYHNSDTIIYKCPVSILVTDAENRWAFFDQRTARAYGTLAIPWFALPSEDGGWTMIHLLPRDKRHTVYVLPVESGSFSMSRSSKKLRSSAYFRDIAVAKGDQLTFSHIPDDLNQTISASGGAEIKPSEIYKVNSTSEIRKGFASLGRAIDPGQIDWSKASVKKSKYSETSIDWWMVKPDENSSAIVIGEDTDGDGVVDFVHADMTGMGKLSYSALLIGGMWSPTNLIEAWLEVNFSLPWARNAYIPHNAEIYFNGVKVAGFASSLPEGHYAFPIPPRAVRFAGHPGDENKIEIKSEHLRGGHYIVTSDFQVVYRLTDVDTFVIAEIPGGCRQEGIRCTRLPLQGHGPQRQLQRSVDLQAGRTESRRQGRDHREPAKPRHGSGQGRHGCAAAGADGERQCDRGGPRHRAGGAALRLAAGQASLDRRAR